MKDEMIAQHQAEKPEYLDMERRQAEEENYNLDDYRYDELTAEQEDFMLEESLERERELKNPTLTTFDLTIQRLREKRDKEGWTATRYFDEIDKEASIELADYKRELELSYGIN